MSKKDKNAMQILKKLIASQGPISYTGCNSIAEKAYLIAEAMETRKKSLRTKEDINVVNCSCVPGSKQCNINCNRQERDKKYE